tara:strand:+ start:68 stop:478 length:411 start_codon:yes stop_codon:yes gene_type:complete
MLFIDKKGTNLFSGKFTFASEESYLNGFLEILREGDMFVIKIKTIDSSNEYKIKFSDTKSVLSKEETRFLSDNAVSYLIDINFYKIFFWIFEPCDEIVCQKLNIGNLSAKRTLKNNLTLIEIVNIQNLFTIKFILR